MGLFSTLAVTSQEYASETGKNNSTNKRSSLSLELPTIVQLYHQSNKPFRLESTALVPPYSVLSYSAVPVTTTTTTTTSQKEKEELLLVLEPASPTKRKKKDLPPELGVWNVCVHKRGSDALLLLPSSESSSSSLTMTAFCLTVDLSKPNQVEPTLSLLQDALIRYLITKPPPPPTTTTSSSETATTSLYALRNVTFGLAPEDEESALSKRMNGEEAGPAPNDNHTTNKNDDDDDDDRKVMFTLAICARLPAADVAAPSSENDNDSYRAKQTQALLTYHLHRYANSLNATLCFVNDNNKNAEPTNDKNLNNNNNNNEQQQPAVGTSQLAYIWRELALGKALNLSVLVPELDEDTAPEEASSSVFSPVYTTANHNPELIETVLLRNAHYPGEWDAAKESLWNILLPLPPSMNAHDIENTQTTATASSGDDAHWLTELRDSVVAATATTTAPPDVTKTPASKAPLKKDVVAPDTAQKDAAVSSFFESLLK